MSTQEQSELPAWLESLRTGERSAAPQSPSSFSADELVGDQALPSWMQPERFEGSDNAQSGPHKALRSSSFSAPNTDEGYLPTKGIPAHSLIDEQALPAWMQQSAAESGSSGSSPQWNIPASSLVQPDAVPEWMKKIQQQQPPVPVQPAQPPAQPTPSQQGFFARDLIDQQSLPEWMLQQNAAPAQNAQQGQFGQSGLSASSLLDMNALPPWMQESSQQQSRAFPPAQPQSPMAPAQINQTWQAPPQQPMQTPPVQHSNPAPTQGGTVPASSFIDINALPEWLRSSAADPRQAAQQGPGGNAGNQASSRPGSYAVPPRVENMRVPNRPRGEVGVNEGSEAAANVFASMLGVASSAPHFPSPSQGVPQPNGQFPPYQSLNNMAGYANPQQPQGYAGSQPQQRYVPGYNGGYQGSSQTNYPMSTPPMSWQQGPMSGMGNEAGYGGRTPSMSGGPAVGGEQRANAKPAKRGLFEALRNLFFRQ